MVDNIGVLVAYLRERVKEDKGNTFTYPKEILNKLVKKDVDTAKELAKKWMSSLKLSEHDMKHGMPQTSAAKEICRICDAVEDL